jgi:putative transposase
VWFQLTQLGEYTVSNDNVVSLKNLAGESVVGDVLTSFLRQSAQRLLQIAVEEEVRLFIEQHRDMKQEAGVTRLVKNGYLPERPIQTGIGAVRVKMPRVRDRSSTQEKIEFSSYWVPKYLRRTATLEVWLPILYLKGISTGDFKETLSPLLGASAPGLSPAVISRLKTQWLEEYQAFLKRDVSDKAYVYWWVDGLYVQARLETEKTCLLVIVGVNARGEKELISLTDGFRESKESWLEVLRDLQARGLQQGPLLATGDGSLGFWGALGEMYPKTQQQRCWVHKTSNVLDKLPKTQQAKAKSALHEIYQSATRVEAEKAFNQFVRQYELKYPKAAACLEKDRPALLSFYAFPAEHWASIRTTNPIESTFATVRHRTKKSKGCFSRDTILSSAFKLCQEAEKHWRTFYGYAQLPALLAGVVFTDGIADQKETLKNAA